MLGVPKILIKTLLFVSFFFSNYPGDWYVKEYYPNGNMREEGWLLKKQKTAYWFTYYSNGNVKSEGHYESNKKTKCWKYYYENHKLKEEGDYLDGQRHSWWTSYFQDGSKKSIGKYEFGKQVGYWKYFRSDKLSKVEKWKDGKLFSRAILKYNSIDSGVYDCFENDLLKYQGIFEKKGGIFTFYNNKGEQIFTLTN